MSNTYYVGDLVTITGTFVDVATAEPVNPGSVVINVRDPNGNQTTPGVTNPTTGTFTAQISPTVAGTWSYSIVGSGGAAAATKAEFFVQNVTLP